MADQPETTTVSTLPIGTEGTAQEMSGSAGSAPTTTLEQDNRSEKGAVSGLSAETIEKMIVTQFAALNEKQKTEAEKLARMSNEEKAAYEQEVREDEYNKRFADLTKRELRIDAHKILGERGMPVELLDVLTYTDAESCKNSIDAVEKAFRSSVEKAVNDRLRGTPPGASASNHQPSYSFDQLKNMSTEEIMANMDAVENALKI